MQKFFLFAGPARSDQSCTVIPGGAVVIDDYGTFEGCRKATDEFLAGQPAVELIGIDFGAVYFLKPG